MDKKERQELELFATQVRRDVLGMFRQIGYGHLGGSMSIVEVLTVLYKKHMKYDPKNPHWEGRDWLVLSKGHAGPALYSTLAECGFFDPQLLLTLNEGGTTLPSHPDRNKTPGVDATTGSLGQGTSVACGIATGLRLAQKDDQYVYLIVGDGELNEGQCWEAFQYLAHFKLNNCIVFIDENKKQLDGETKDIINPFDIQKKLTAFGFKTLRVKGNSLEEIDRAITEQKQVKDQAVAIVLDTIKGQGLPYFEQLGDNHAVKFSSEELKRELENAIQNLDEVICGGEKRCSN